MPTSSDWALHCSRTPPFAQRIWELRGNVTAYDAWYVALAEALGSELATVDLRLSRASGCQCVFLTPPR